MPASLQKIHLTNSGHEDTPNNGLAPSSDATVRHMLRENYAIWSPGMSRSAYYHYQWWQLQQDWARSNLRHWSYHVNGEPVTGCKLYNLSFRSRGRTIRIAGIGAVFTPERHRGRGYALRLLDAMKQLCKDRGYQGLMLNSDIDPAYYGRVGFQLLGSRDFYVRLTPNLIAEFTEFLNRASSHHCSQGSLPDQYLRVRPFELTDLGETLRYHGRWLARQSYGMERSEDYWRFKVRRELFLHRYSTRAWPRLQLVTLNFGRADGGYAVFEQSRDVMRVLEVIGPEWAGTSLWNELWDICRRRDIRVIRGWHNVLPPGWRLPNVERSWGRPMMLALDENLSAWLEVNPCPLLELDHF